MRTSLLWIVLSLTMRRCGQSLPVPGSGNVTLAD